MYINHIGINIIDQQCHRLIWACPFLRLYLNYRATIEGNVQRVDALNVGNSMRSRVIKSSLRNFELPRM